MGLSRYPRPLSLQHRNFRVPARQSPASVKLDKLSIKTPSGVFPDNILKHVAKRMRQDMRLSSAIPKFKQDTLAVYEGLTRQEQKLVRRWVAGYASEASADWAHESSSKAPYFVLPESVFAFSNAKKGAYSSFQRVFNSLPSFPALMIREMKDFKPSDQGFMANLSKDLVALLNLFSTPSSECKIEPQKKPQWETDPNGLLGAVIKAIESHSTIIMPQSSCTTSDEYRHIDSPKVSFLMLGEGVYIHDILAKHINIDLCIPYSVQDEVVNREQSYSVVSMLQFEEEGELVVVMESSPGEIARKLGRGDTVAASQACIRDYFASVRNDAANDMMSVHIDFRGMPASIGF